MSSGNSRDLASGMQLRCGAHTRVFAEARERVNEASSDLMRVLLLAAFATSLRYLIMQSQRIDESANSERSSRCLRV